MDHRKEQLGLAEIEEDMSKTGIDLEYTLKRWSPVITPEFRKNHIKSDLVMIQCEVPMGRNADLDLIRINNCPYALADMDTEVEKVLRNIFGQQAAFDLSVRKYKDDTNYLDFLIIYVGQCQRRDQIISHLI